MFIKRFGLYFKHLKPVQKQFALGLTFGVISATATGAGIPFITEHLIPLVTSEDKPQGFKLLLLLSSIPLVFLLRAAGGFLNTYLMAYAGLHVLEQIRVMAFTRIQYLPIAFFSKNHVGDLMSRVSGDTSQLKNALIKVANSLVKEPATLVSAIGYLIYLSFKESEAILMLIALVTVPACVFPIRLIGTRIFKKAQKAQKQAGELNSVLNENLSAVREVRAYNLEEREINRYSAAVRKLFKLSLKTVKYGQALSPMIELVTAFALSFAVYIAVQKNIAPKTIGAILTALYVCYGPIKKLGTVSNTISQAEASLDRLEHILNAPDSVPDPANPTPLKGVSGEIFFNNVTFAYDSEVALNNVSATIKAGEAIALVGPSGAGKTTFANLVPRFYDVVEGSISLDGVDVRELSKHDLRSQIALVSQDATLFSDTIANNIRLSKPDATLDEIKTAAEMAHAHDFIEAFEDGYETMVGERGSRLSGGQRQRIAIARAFLKDAPIIVLDEPTSALDAESEHKIQTALEGLSKGRTVLIIAHRFSTVQHADRILVFDDGAIIAQGTHAELYESNPLYTSLYNKQATTTLSSNSKGTES